MSKPLTVASEELSQKIAQIINESGVPAFVVRYILKDLDSQLVTLAKNQLNSDFAEWSKQQDKKESEVNQGD